MPRFYVDIDEGQRQLPDTEGTELPEHQTFTCRVRDEKTIFIASLARNTGWTEAPGMAPS
jgi:hypothetical protein